MGQGHSEAAIAATEGAAVVYHAVNVPYHLQVSALPGIAEAVLAAVAQPGARLVVLDTRYPYGEADGEAITERTPWAATSRKGKLRAELDRRYLEAHENGEASVVLGRAADFFGPGVINSSLGGALFLGAITGGPAVGIGDLTLPHSYTYIKDLARGLAELGNDPRGDGRVWHLPTNPATSTAEVHALVEELTGRELDVQVMGEPKAFGPFDEQFMVEYAEMFYQHDLAEHGLRRIRDRVRPAAHAVARSARRHGRLVPGRFRRSVAEAVGREGWLGGVPGRDSGRVTRLVRATEPGVRVPSALPTDRGAWVIGADASRCTA